MRLFRLKFLPTIGIYQTRNQSARPPMNDVMRLKSDPAPKNEFGVCNRYRCSLAVEIVGYHVRMGRWTVCIFHDDGETKLCTQVVAESWPRRLGTLKPRVLGALQ